MPRSLFLILAISVGGALVAPVEAVEAPAYGDSCMVVSAHPEATRLGVSILHGGGNAVDAAVAVSFCLAGCEPYSSGLGGGGFFVFFDPVSGRVQTLDARETAPSSAHRDMFLVAGKPDPSLSRDGPLSAGVPGLVAGLKELHEKGGSLPWPELVGAAAQTIREIDVSPMLHERIVRHASRFNAAARKVFLPQDRTPDIGSLLVQDDLYATMQAIAENGPDAFYGGKVAAALVAASTNAQGSCLTLADLSAYRPRWRDPIHGRYHDLDVYSMAPPSSGGVHLVQMLNILEHFNFRDAGFGSAASVHSLTEAMKFAYADRSLFLGDSDFVTVPVNRLISSAYADSLRGLIRPGQAYPEELIQGTPLLDVESHETTHFSVVDTGGMAVAATLTINLTFGCGRMAAGTGVLLNNEMDDFVSAPGTPNAFGLVGGEANSIAPGKRPLSSMTPTIVLKDGQVRMVTGAPGGSRIITTTLQTIVNVVDHDMNVLQAVKAPRIHHQWFPRHLYYEEFGLNSDTRKILESMGHTLVSRTPMCNAQVIVIDPGSGLRQGASDPRGMGLASGF
jgi:gamma-glutamyltranspeptidase / glutathione hydrolase